MTEEKTTRKTSCKTNYPIVLVHGIGYEDDSNYSYWGDIPEELIARGAKVFFGGQKSFESVIDNAKILKENILTLTKEYEKVNLIAHSKGGIEARYMISQLDMGKYVASLTTMATPHHGIKTMDIMREKGLLPGFLNLFRMIIKIGGGNFSKSNKDFGQMSEDYLSVFNDLVYDDPNVYYQSYAFDMKKPNTEPGLGFFHKTVKKYEGKNDGIVSVESAQWGDFQGVKTGLDKKGISHSMAAGGRGKKKSEVTNLYINVVERLKKLGY